LWVVYASPDYMAGRAQLKLTVAEKQKWDAVYEAMPLTNDQDDAVLRSFHQELLDLVGAVLPVGATVLEAGCGGGAQSLSLARDGGYAVSLLDFSPQALDYARRLFAQQNVPVQTIEADAFAIAQPSADMVFNAGVLEHYTFEEQVRFVRGMASRSHQYVMVLIPNRACYWYWVWRVQQASQGEWPYGKEVPLVDLQAVFEAAGMHFMSHAFIGQRWTDLFVEQLDGMGDALKAMIGQVHQMGLVQDFSRGYLLAALASKTPVQPLKKGGSWHTAGLTQLRQSADQTALLADALSGQIAAHHGLVQWQGKAQELQTQASTLQASMLSMQESSHVQIMDAQVQLASVQQQREAAGHEVARLSQSLVAEQTAAQQEIARLSHSLVAEQTAAQQEIARLVQSLVAEQTAAKTEFDRGRAALHAQQQAALRLSVWAQEIDQAPFSHGIKKTGRRVARAIWQRLPLSPQMRQSIKQRLSALRPRDALPPVPAAVQPIEGQALPHNAHLTSAPVVADSGPRTDRDWLVFAVIDWHFRTQRPQHLARELALAGSRVFYISNHFVDAAQPGYTMEQLSALGDGLVLYQVCLHVPGAPAIYFNAPSQLVRGQVASSLAKLVLEQQIENSCALLQHAFWKDVAFALPNSLRVYDCMDHHAG
ncbi:MAG: methyltransferase domain-containing protein, partial [Burkholderiaceae bacterium]